MEDRSNWGPEAKHFVEREEAGLVAGFMSCVSTEKFYPMPEKIGEDMIFGYLWSIDKMGVSQAVAREQLRERLKSAIDVMRPRLFQCQDLNPARIGVMLHVALALGVHRVMEMSKVWEALRALDYDKAADELLLSEWPVAVGFDDFCRRRIVALANVLRHGERRNPERIAKTVAS